MLASLLLASCASVAPAPMRVLPPLELLQDCPEPPIQAATNGQLAESILALRDSLRGCNRDKAALREWAEAP
jgi:hypothetical protein